MSFVDGKAIFSVEGCENLSVHLFYTAQTTIDFIPSLCPPQLLPDCVPLAMSLNT